MHTPTRRSVLQAASCIAAFASTPYCFATRREAPPHIRRLALAGEREIDIGKAALDLGAELYPVDVSAHVRKLDELASRVRSRITMGRNRTDPEAHVGALIATLVREERFAYDHSPGSMDNSLNSFLHSVMERKVGTCVGLPVLYVSVAQRADIPIYTVQVPDHMFARYNSVPPAQYPNIECTSGGKFLTDESYIDGFYVSERGLKSGAYMRTMSRRELLGTLFFTSTLVAISRKDYDSALWYIENGAVMAPRDAYLAYAAMRIFDFLAKLDPSRWGGLKPRARLMEARADDLGYVPFEVVRKNGPRPLR